MLFIRTCNACLFESGDVGCQPFCFCFFSYIYIYIYIYGPFLVWNLVAYFLMWGTYLCFAMRLKLCQNLLAVAIEAHWDVI